MNIEISVTLPTNHKFDNIADALKFTLRSIVSLVKQGVIDQSTHRTMIEDAGSGMWNIWCDDLVGDGPAFLQVYEENCGFEDVCFLCADGSNSYTPIHALPELFIYYIMKQIIREFYLGDTLKIQLQ